MDNINREKKISLIAAIYFAILAVYNIASDVGHFYYGDDLYTTAYILLWLGLIGLTITLFLRNKKAVLITAGVTCLGYVLLHSHFIDFVEIIGVLAYVVLCIIIVLSLKGFNIVNRICFLASILKIAEFLSSLIYYYRFNISFIFQYHWSYMLSLLLEVLAFLFTGLWLKEDLTPIQFKTSKQNKTSSVPAVEIGGAEKLKAIKELLDNGIITQEEYESKKKQILG